MISVSGIAMAGLWDVLQEAVAWLKESVGPAPRRPLFQYYIANPEVIRLSLAIGGLETFLNERPRLTASEGQLSDAAREWFHAFPGYYTSQPQVTGVLLALNRSEIAELRGFAEAVEGALHCVGLRIPYLIPENLRDRIQQRGEGLRWNLNQEVQQRHRQLRRNAKALGVFASNHEIWDLHIAVNALKVLASKARAGFEIKHLLFDAECALIPAGRPDQALKGIALGLSAEEKESLRDAARAVWSVARFALENGSESPSSRPIRESDATDAAIDEVASLLAERLTRGERFK